MIRPILQSTFPGVFKYLRYLLISLILLSISFSGYLVPNESFAGFSAGRRPTSSVSQSQRTATHSTRHTRHARSRRHSRSDASSAERSRQHEQGRAELDHRQRDHFRDQGDSHSGSWRSRQSSHAGLDRQQQSRVQDRANSPSESSRNRQYAPVRESYFKTDQARREYDFVRAQHFKHGSSRSSRKLSRDGDKGRQRSDSAHDRSTTQPSRTTGKFPSRQNRGSRPAAQPQASSSPVFPGFHVPSSHNEVPRFNRSSTVRFQTQLSSSSGAPLSRKRRGDSQQTQSPSQNTPPSSSGAGKPSETSSSPTLSRLDIHPLTELKVPSTRAEKKEYVRSLLKGKTTEEVQQLAEQVGVLPKTLKSSLHPDTSPLGYVPLMKLQARDNPQARALISTILSSSPQEKKRLLTDIRDQWSKQTSEREFRHALGTEIGVSGFTVKHWYLGNKLPKDGNLIKLVLIKQKPGLFSSSSSATSTTRQIPKATPRKKKRPPPSTDRATAASSPNATRLEDLDMPSQLVKMRSKVLKKHPTASATSTENKLVKRVNKITQPEEKKRLSQVVNSLLDSTKEQKLALLESMRTTWRTKMEKSLGTVHDIQFYTYLSNKLGGLQAESIRNWFPPTPKASPGLIHLVKLVSINNKWNKPAHSSSRVAKNATKKSQKSSKAEAPERAAYSSDDDVPLLTLRQKMKRGASSKGKAAKEPKKKMKRKKPSSKVVSNPPTKKKRRRRRIVSSSSPSPASSRASSPKPLEQAVTTYTETAPPLRATPPKVTAPTARQVAPAPTSRGQAPLLSATSPPSSAYSQHYVINQAIYVPLPAGFTAYPGLETINVNGVTHYRLARRPSNLPPQSEARPLSRREVVTNLSDGNTPPAVTTHTSTPPPPKEVTPKAVTPAPPKTAPQRVASRTASPEAAPRHPRPAGKTTLAQSYVDEVVETVKREQLLEKREQLLERKKKLAAQLAAIPDETVTPARQTAHFTGGTPRVTDEMRAESIEKLQRLRNSPLTDLQLARLLTFKGTNTARAQSYLDSEAILAPDVVRKILAIDESLYSTPAKAKSPQPSQKPKDTALAPHRQPDLEGPAEPFSRLAASNVEDPLLKKRPFAPHPVQADPLQMPTSPRPEPSPRLLEPNTPPPPALAVDPNYSSSDDLIDERLLRVLEL